MKPHEEEWSIELDNDTGPNDEGFWEWYQVGPVKVSIPTYGSKEERAHAESVAKLVSQAPAMARLLLKATVKPDGNEWGCLGCNTWEEGNHTEDCELIALLKDAGVIP